MPIITLHHTVCAPRVPITRSRIVDHTIMAKLSDTQTTQKVAAGVV